MVEKGNCVSPFFWVRLYASYIVLFFFSKTRRLENENRDCYFHTIYFCWKENLTFDTSIPDRMVSNWGDCILYNTLSSLSLSKLEIWWKGTSHSNQVVVLGLVVVVHTDHHVCTMVQKLGNLFWLMHPTTNLVGCVIQKRSFYSYITFA